MVSRVHVYIGGRVQGVFFRAWTKKLALRFGITGWVRNLADGRVEIVAEGQRQVLEQFVKYLRKGPRIATVEEIDVTWGKTTELLKGFKILHGV